MLRRFLRSLNFLKYNTHPARIEMKSRKLVLLGANKAFELFKDQQFRSLIKFDKMIEDEQNRVFNELVVTNLILLMLLLDRFALEADRGDKKEYLTVLRKAVPEYFNSFIGTLGIPEKFVNIWKKLVDLRYDEYINSTHEIRGEFLQHDDAEIRDHAMDFKLMIFQSIAIGLYDHIMRGKIYPKSPIYKYLQPYLFKVYTGYLQKI